MKNLRWVGISLMAAGAVAGLLLLGGCSDRHSNQQGYRGGRFSVEATARGGRSVAGESVRPQGRQGREALRSSGCDEPRIEGRYAVPAADRRGAQGSRSGSPAAGFQSDGRSVAASGQLVDLTGTLESRNAEWYLNQQGTRYLLHLGNARYVESSGIPLQEGATVRVRGFAAADEVAVVSVTVGGQRFEFREENGTPLWAGRGRRAGGNGRDGSQLRGGTNREERGGRAG
jgi:hypothetical protein